MNTLEWNLSNPELNFLLFPSCYWDGCKKNLLKRSDEPIWILRNLDSVIKFLGREGTIGRDFGKLESITLKVEVIRGGKIQW